MPANPFQLDQIQKWMQSVITHPEGVVAGVESEAAQEEIPVSPDGVDDVVTRSQSLTSLQRLQIYGNAYHARLVECLRDEFPAVHRALGEDIFTAYAMGYLQHYPSQSYTLAQLGAKFPQFLAECPPLLMEDKPAYWPDFVADLAKLERNYSEVFDGPGIEGQQPLTAEMLQEIPPEAWPAVRILPVPSLRLMRLGFPAHEYITAVRHEQTATVPEPAETLLAISRREFVVRREPLTALQYELLTQIIAGQRLGEAIQSTVENLEVDFAEFAASLQTWFQNWTASQLFLRVTGD